MLRIFLSYDHEDVAFAKPLAVALEKAGHTVWYDRHIHGGAQYSQKIEQALDAADAVVVLWSQRSLESAWVRDEAAEGRDRGKLVPLSIGGATPPMGFRQYQTIELGAWQGRGKVPRLQELLQAVESQAEELPPSDAEPKIDKALRRSIEYRKRPLRWWGIAALVALAALTAAGGVWWSRTASLPVVEVAAANSSAKSKAAASDLYVKLGSLAQVGQGKWRLIDGSSNSDKPDLSFRTADTGLPGSPRANLVLLDKSGSLLWSREFAPPPGGSEADLRQQVSITAGRVLGCSLDSSENGGLPRDELKLFLTTCAAGLEAAYADNVSITRQLRSIVQNHPHFKPAWKQLLLSQMTVVDFNNLGAEGTEETENLRQLRADVENARKAFPDLAQITLAEVHLLPRVNYLQELALFQKAISQAPDDPSIQAEQLQPLMRVGRMLDGVTAARRAVQLDPLSAHAQMQLILSLAYAGQIGEAREELAKLEQQWPDSGTVKDARWAFNLRFGDPRIAAAMTSEQDPITRLFLDARLAPSPAKIDKLIAYIKPYKLHSDQDVTAFAIQALGQFNRIDEVFQWIANSPVDVLTESSYVLFRPALAGVRKDPRFIAVAKRIGLVRYWQATGRWPDFCDDPSLPYNCKTEAAKYGA